MCLTMRETFLGILTVHVSISYTYCQAVNRIHLIEPIWLITATFKTIFTLSAEILSQVTQMYSNPTLKNV